MSHESQPTAWELNMIIFSDSIKKKVSNQALTSIFASLQVSSAKHSSINQMTRILRFFTNFVRNDIQIDFLFLVQDSQIDISFNFSDKKTSYKILGGLVVSYQFINGSAAAADPCRSLVIP